MRPRIDPLEAFVAYGVAAALVWFLVFLTR